MTIERKVGMGIAGQPSGDAANVADVFSTYLYKGTGADQTITNGIDLAGEGGLVWIKARNQAYSNILSDTAQGVDKYLKSESTDAQGSNSSYAVKAFNSNGFTAGSWGFINGSANDYASWTFRKKKKFFDVVTYTGNGVAGLTISHALGTSVGMIMIKSLTSGWWGVYHKSKGNGYIVWLHSNSAGGNSGDFNNTTPTETHFTLGAGGEGNSNGTQYVAYLFADNSSEDAEDQMIKCGSYTTDGSGNATIDLGWEPQFVITKKTSGTGDWNIWDTMRGWNGYNYDYLRANAAGAETGNTNYGNPTATGFTSNGVIGANSSGIYMAIRAPMMKEPEAATEVFAVATKLDGDPIPPNYLSGFPVDMFISRPKNDTTNTQIESRLLGQYNYTNTVDAVDSDSSNHHMDLNNGLGRGNGANAIQISWMWKRAKGFFDVVTYKGTGNQPTNHKHSLGVVPELIIVKAKDKTENWVVMDTLTAASFPASGSVNTLNLNLNGITGETNIWHYTAPTDVHFTTNDNVKVNSSSYNYVAYLFATLEGISKVGSYTGNGSYQTINCGFSSGARFILIKRTNASGDWYFWDSVRGIVAGNDPHLSMNNTAVSITNDDSVDPHNSGFIVNQVAATNINVSSGKYIFYAIA